MEESEEVVEYDFAILLRASKTEEDNFSLLESHDVREDPEQAKALLWQSLQSSGLELERLRSIDGKQTLIKVRAPQELLEIGAEQMRLKKRRKVDLTWTVFSRKVIHIFADATSQDDDKSSISIHFVECERQMIVHHLITSSARVNETSNYAYIVQQMFPLHKKDLDRLRHNWVTYWRPPRTSLIESSVSTQCCTSTAPYRLVRYYLDQPLDQVQEYFGEKIAFYFAFLELYTRWLVLPSIAGIGLFAIQIYNSSLDQPLAPYYAIFMAIWASLFLIAWKRRAHVLAYRWGVLGFEEEERTRAEFRGDASLSKNGIRRYPFWKRAFKYIITWNVVLLCIGCIVILMYLAFQQKDQLEADSVNAKKAQIQLGEISLSTMTEWASLVDWDFWFYLIITPVLYGLLIPILDNVFTRMAKKLNGWENHKTESAYQTHLILKVFSFRFVHVFASLYYYAFASGANLFKVAIQLAAFMIAGQTWNNVMETGLPLLKRRLIVWKNQRKTDAGLENSSVFSSEDSLQMNTPFRKQGNVSPTRYRINSLQKIKLQGVVQEQCSRLEQASAKAWEESQLGRYDTFEDYTEILIQFGYVSFFSIAFPLAPLLALLNNLFELRGDAFKLCNSKQRPVARKASGIGIWFSVLQLMSVLAVITNCVHIAFTTTQIETQIKSAFNISLSPSDKVWVVFVAEHVILAGKVWIAFVIPTMPYAVKRKIRLENEHLKAESAQAIANSMIEEDSI